MSFTINNKLSFINTIQFLSSSLDSLVKNLNENDFKYLSQEFGSNVLDLVKQKGLYPNEYRVIFKSLRKVYQAKKSFIVHWLIEKSVTKNMNMFLMFGKKLK